MTIQQLEQQAHQAMAAGNLAEAERLADHADTLDRATPTATLAAAAHWYVTLGLHVFPLQPGTKIPYPKSRGCLDATTNPTQITTWWITAPDSNIGIATGHLVDVIDIDGPHGVKTWTGDLWDQLPPILGQAHTARPGGHHLYIATIDGAGNRAHMLPGIDYRGKGGYVVAAPSIVAGKTYRWTSPLELP